MVNSVINVSEVAFRGVLCKKAFLEISQNLQENNFARVSFLIKLQASCNFIKKETLAQVFCCEFCEIFKNTFFTELLRATVSAGIVDFRRNVFQKQSPVVFCKKAAASEPLFHKVAGQTCNFIKKDSKKGVFL